jgi:hypothetical protein
MFLSIFSLNLVLRRPFGAVLGLGISILGIYDSSMRLRLHTAAAPCILFISSFHLVPF